VSDDWYLLFEQELSKLLLQQFKMVMMPFDPISEIIDLSLLLSLLF
jgi:hypothetical protein